MWQNNIFYAVSDDPDVSQNIAFKGKISEMHINFYVYMV